MIKVLLDTSVFISSVPGKRRNEKRTQKAQCVLNFLRSNKNYKICYSERTQNELENDKDLNELSDFERLNSHILNETWTESELRWSNLASKWTDDGEVKFGDKLEKTLPDRSNKTNRNDRGIYGDAFYNKCQFLIHENPKDFNKFSANLNLNDVTLINLLNHSCNQVIQKLKQNP